MSTKRLNDDVTSFLDEQDHPLRAEIEYLRKIILKAESTLVENIKWNAPNYRFKEVDRVTLRIHPPRQVQIIFHRGAKVKAQPRKRLIDDPSGLLQWKENDRATLTFKTLKEIKQAQKTIVDIVNRWVHAG